MIKNKGKLRLSGSREGELGKILDYIYNLYIFQGQQEESIWVYLDWSRRSNRGWKINYHVILTSNFRSSKWQNTNWWNRHIDNRIIITETINYDDFIRFSFIWRNDKREFRSIKIVWRLKLLEVAQLCCLGDILQ